MVINNKQLKKVKVQTQGGQSLGLVSDFDLQSESGEIIRYYVKTKISLAGLFNNQLVIDKDQIISFDGQVMIVEDNVIKVEKKETSLLKKVQELESSEPIVTTQQLGDSVSDSEISG